MIRFAVLVVEAMVLLLGLLPFNHALASPPCDSYDESIHWIARIDLDYHADLIQLIFEDSRYYYLTRYGDAHILRVRDGMPGPELAFVPTGFNTSSIDVEHGALFAIDGTNSLDVFNVASALHPAHVEHHEVPSPSAVMAEDSLLVVATRLNGLYVYSIQNRLNLTLESVTELPASGRVVLRNGVAYVTHFDASLTVVDLSVPAEPVITENVALDLQPSKIAANDSLLFVLNQYSGVSLYSLEDQRHPVHLTHIALPFHCMDIDVNEDLACIAIQGAAGPSGGGLAVLDIRNPRDARVLGLGMAPHTCSKVAIAGDKIVCGWNRNRLDVIDIGNMSMPQALNLHEVSQMPSRLSVLGNIVVAMSGRGGVSDACGYAVLDAADPLAISTAYSRTMPDVSPEAMAFIETVGCMAGQSWEDGQWKCRIQAIDFSSPSRPLHMGMTVISGSPYQVVAVEKTLCLTFKDSADLAIVDISDPWRPALIRRYSLAGSYAALAATGTMLFAKSGDRLQVLELIRPREPQVLNELELPFGFMNLLAVDDEYILAGGGSVVSVIRWSSGAALRLCGTVELPSTAVMLDLRGTLGLAAGTSLYLFDLSDPSHPVLLDGSIGFVRDAHFLGDVIVGVVETQNGQFGDGIASLPLPCSTVSVEPPESRPQEGTAASEVVILAVAPNPSRSSIDLSFRLSVPQVARVSVIDLRGRLVRTLADGALASGLTTLHWDGCDEDGALAAAGTYFLAVVGEKDSECRRICLIK